MRIPPHLAWLFCASLYSNAFDIPLYIERSTGNPENLLVNVPQNKHVEIIPSDKFFFTLCAEDAKSLWKSAAKKTTSDRYKLELFTSVRLGNALRIERSRVVIIKWSDSHEQLIMEITTWSQNPAVGYIPFHDLGLDKQWSGPIANVLVNGINSHEVEKQLLYFDFSNVYSHFPDWAYELLIGAFPYEVESRSIEPIECNELDKLELPILQFATSDCYLFEFTKSNYFWRRHQDDTCVLAVRRSVSNVWIIGPTISKTYRTVFASFLDSNNLHIGFINPLGDKEISKNSSLAVTV